MSLIETFPPPNFKKCIRFKTKKSKLPLYDVKKGIKSDKKHYISFMTDTPITLLGFGIYGIISRKTINVEYAIYGEDFCNKLNQRIVLRKTNADIEFDGHRKIIPLFFPSPVNLISYDPYVLYFNADSYQTYNGFKGQCSVKIDKVTFLFNNNWDPVSLSTPEYGNFPQIYFLIPVDKKDKIDETDSNCKCAPF